MNAYSFNKRWYHEKVSGIHISNMKFNSSVEMKTKFNKTKSSQRIVNSSQRRIYKTYRTLEAQLQTTAQQ